MSAATPLTDEHYRILRAAAEGRLVASGSGRWLIEGEMRPDRRSRERLKARGLIGYGVGADGRMDWRALALTHKGREALR